MVENNHKRGRPQKYVFWSDWERWQLKEWMPFKMNDFAHLKADVAWLKIITIGILLAIVGSAIAILVSK